MDIFNTLERFLKKHDISGIFFIPGYGSATIFRNELDKLAVLDHSKLELRVEKGKCEEEVIRRIRNETGGIIKIKYPGYLG